MELISVIVPVYKVEQYLDECVESIVNQTYTNLEIILINDGSPDKCPQICEQWAERDVRIKVIHTKNNGAGYARNIGTAMATGDYISFIDSDDYVSKHFFQHLLSLFDKDVDIVECDYISTAESYSQFTFDSVKDVIESTTEEALKMHILNQHFKQVIWNKLYRREVLSNIKFPVGKKIDDEFWTYRVLGNAKRLIHSEQVLYAYRQQEQSVMHQAFSLERLQALEAKVLRLEYIRKKHKDILYVAKNDLWLTCLYMGQMSLKYLSKEHCYKAFYLIQEVLKEYPLERYDISKLSLTYKVWGIMSKYSIKSVCMIRNILRIGI